jgi:hypothetical protein
MALPMWKDDWEKPDPFRGKGGWTFRDYVNLGMGVGLAVALFATFVLAVASAHRMQALVHGQNEQREEMVAPPSARAEPTPAGPDPTSPP